MGRTLSKKVIGAASALVVAVSVLMLSSITSLLFAAKRDPQFPRLSENRAGSPTFEVRRQIKGHVQAMFALPKRNQVLIVAEGHLWRFSADGRLLDTLYSPDDMHRSGIAFGAEGFVDWIHTGVAAVQPYAPEVDGRALDEAGLRAALAQARVVAFGKSQTQAWAWLWDGASAWKMDISHLRGRVDTDCTLRSSTQDPLRWSDTCLIGVMPPTALMLEVRPQAFAGTFAGESVGLEVVDFDRRRYHLEDGPVGHVVDVVVGGALKAIAPDLPGGLAQRYWFGDAHTRLRLGQEYLRFKVFVARHKGDYDFFDAVDWWDPSQALPGASPWLRVRMRGNMELAGEEALWELYREDFGMYAIRPRISPHDLAEPAGPALRWAPAFEGPPTGYTPVIARVDVEGGSSVHRWLRARPARQRVSYPTLPLDADTPALTRVPESMRVEWGSPWNEEAHTVLQVRLDPGQTRQAFAQVGAGEQASLLLRVPDVHGETDSMQVVLRQSGREVVLDKASLAHLKRPAFRPWSRTGADQDPPNRLKQLQATAAAVRQGNTQALSRFQAQVQALLGKPDVVKAAAATITAEYAGLIVHFNLDGNASTSLQLASHYLDQVHPFTSVHLHDETTAYNISVIASQILAVGIHQPDARALVERIEADLLGPSFDPASHPNATLLYNLACLYAVRGDRARMLAHAAAALDKGKPASQFLADTDFAAYREDAQFKVLMSAQ